MAYILLTCNMVGTDDSKKAAMNSHTEVQFEHFKENNPSNFRNTFSHTASTSIDINTTRANRYI